MKKLSARVAYQKLFASNYSLQSLMHCLDGECWDGFILSGDYNNKAGALDA